MSRADGTPGFPAEPRPPAPGPARTRPAHARRPGPDRWDSPRFTESVRPAHLWMHHLEVRGWLRQAYGTAG